MGAMCRMNSSKLSCTIFFLVIFSGFQTLCFAAAVAAIEGKNAVITSGSALASQAGIEVMKQGGNAVDAAVAVGFALAVTPPSAGNLGGGTFILFQN